jgi:hypothetical protein
VLSAGTKSFQGAAGGAVATIVIGFYWSGWTLGSTAEKQVKDAEQASIVRVLAPICADKFQRSADASPGLHPRILRCVLQRNERAHERNEHRRSDLEPAFAGR